MDARGCFPRTARVGRVRRCKVPEEAARGKITRCESDSRGGRVSALSRLCSQLFISHAILLSGVASAGGGGGGLELPLKGGMIAGGQEIPAAAADSWPQDVQQQPQIFDR